MKKPKRLELKFGDVVKNEWASDANPQKFLIYVSGGKMIRCLSFTGRIVNFDNDKDLRLTKMGSLDFSKWKGYIDKHIKQKALETQGDSDE